MFNNREDAGTQLAEALKADNSNCDKEKVVVVALPRGGVPVAFPIAKMLHVPLDIVVPRKIGSPFNKEFAIGAVCENGEGIFNEQVIREYNIHEAYIKHEVEEQVQEAHRRLHHYRGNRGPQDFAGKTVIVVDDGVATGATMKVAIQSLKSKGACKLIVAVPVAPTRSLNELRPLVDKIVCIASPVPFRAVGNFYKSFEQTNDEEVIQLMSDPSLVSFNKSNAP